jgi:hypothetical protein
MINSSKTMVNSSKPMWISRKDERPKDGQRIRVRGIPSWPDAEEVCIKITYLDKVGLISNITHWQPVE